jgi:hypothetical protein
MIAPDDRAALLEELEKLTALAKLLIDVSRDAEK